jgi:hypothetical protein
LNNVRNAFGRQLRGRSPEAEFSTTSTLKHDLRAAMTAMRHVDAKSADVLFAESLEKHSVRSATRSLRRLR